jgi:hypothetical protein
MRKEMLLCNIEHHSGKVQYKYTITKGDKENVCVAGSDRRMEKTA